jgi:hypothetical protein
VNKGSLDSFLAGLEKCKICSLPHTKNCTKITKEHRKGQEYAVLRQILLPSGTRVENSRDSPGWTNSEILELSRKSEWKVRDHHGRTQEVTNFSEMWIWWRIATLVDWSETREYKELPWDYWKEKKSWMSFWFCPHILFSFPRWNCGNYSRK